MICPRLYRLRTVCLLLMGMALAILAGCAAPGKIIPDADTAFQRTGRFSVSVSPVTGNPEAAQGGFAWLDTGDTLTLDLANPLGSTLARVTVHDNMAILTHSNGTQEYAEHADGLVERVLGSPVPVSGLRDWLHGRTGSAPVYDLRTDSETDQPSSFVQDGWRVSLSRYDALGPTVLQMNRNDAQRNIRVRLVISPQSGAL